MDKITSSHPNSQSMNLVEENIEKLKAIFPTIVTEGKVDLEELKSLLGEYIETSDEYYRFTWAGKSNARLEANKPSSATLRPNQNDSKDWDTTQNLFLEGDNLEVLKLLQKSYVGKIKMIYIDPPYNTGKEFVYKDNYADNLANYLAITNQTDEAGKKFSVNTETDGRYHSNWLNMMYPRLKLARNLLEDEGMIFISIDDNEIGNLKRLCDEIFGEENFISQIIWEKRYGRSNDQKFFSSVIDYILLYRKSENLKQLREGRTEKSNEIYSNPDNDPRGAWTSVSFVSQRTKQERKNLAYDIINPHTKTSFSHPVNAWKFSEEKFNELLNDNRFYWGKDGTQLQPRIKRFLSELPDGLVPVNLWKHQEVGTGEIGTREVDLLLGKEIFTFPKPTTLLKKIIQIGSDKDSIILDFFAGSGSTSDAVMQINAEDGGQRKFISVQLPEIVENNTEAYAAGYRTIADITKERIRRAGVKINEELKSKSLDKSKNLDFGFKAFKLDTSNIISWDGSVENFESNLFNSTQSIKSARTDIDVLFEILLKQGLKLTAPILIKKYDEKIIYNVGEGFLFVCLDDKITTSIAEEIGKWKQEIQPISSRVIFKDSGLSDVDKTNSIQILKRFDITDVTSI